ncbi:transcriptional regulator, TetR family [Nannocystis exedens]|uniref:Transcriptional regulator, TetR family n=1 Tax=Nannocystis exedens TaxID=54 RepID=A0A1I2FDA0_9BACT|nr:TetR/AcrR family transcriptional regulator [Nannocystis exedens]PCC70535.1 Bacterial regulatory protein, tetR family [Nannocystis exedens]SFF02727.1 transcriptional regulator, TetR family [Nannocystis exedens]
MDRSAPTPARRRIKKKSADAYHHGDLRRALIDAAAAAVARRGVDALNVSSLAVRLGVSGGAPFRHFESRLALLVAVAEEGARRLFERMEAAAGCVAAPLDKQRARGVAYVRFAVEEPGFFRALTHAEVVAASPLLQQLGAVSQQTMDEVLGRAHQGVSSPALVARSAGLLAAQALTYGLARMITDGLLGDLSAEEAERLTYEITGVLGVGLKASS